MRPTKQTEASLEAKGHLERILLEQLRRTFDSESWERGEPLVADLLRRLDEQALREYAYLHGLTTEYETEPEEPPASSPREDSV